MQARVERIRFTVSNDPTPDLHHYEQVRSDSPDRAKAQARLQAYENGDWRPVGIQARAVLVFDDFTEDTPVTYVGNEIVTPGIWGVESDADSEDFYAAATEELRILVDMLSALRLDRGDNLDWTGLENFLGDRVRSSSQGATS